MKTIENGIRRYHSEFDRPDGYYEKDGVDWKEAAKLKDRCSALYDKRWQAACEVIDIVADVVGLDAEKTGRYIYIPTWDSETETAGSPLADKIGEWLDRGGDKAALKKRVGELENENAVLRSLIGAKT